MTVKGSNSFWKFAKITANFYEDEIQKQVRQYYKWLNIGENYVKKYILFQTLIKNWRIKKYGP